MTAARHIVIRSATRADVAEILAMIVELAVYEREPNAVKATEESLGDMLFGPQPIAEALLAEVDGAPAGVALFFHTMSTWSGKRGLYLEDLFVRPPYRGLGLGKQLMAQLAQLAVARDCARFEWSVLDWNTPAIDFYRSIGAVGMNEWTVQRLEGEALRALAALHLD